MSKQMTICTLKKSNKNPSKRRSKGQGTIWQDRNGKWRCQIVIGMKANGTAERRSFSGTSMDEVQRKLNEFIQLANASFDTQSMQSEEVTSARISAQTRITVSQIARRWLWDYKRIEICTKTCEWYDYLIHSMIEPHIGGRSALPGDYAWCANTYKSAGNGRQLRGAFGSWGAYDIAAIIWTGKSAWLNAG